MICLRRLAPIYLIALGLAAAPLWAAEEKEEPKPQPITLADGALQAEAPGEWKPQQPRVSLIEHEFEIPAPTDDDDQPVSEPGRLTVMLSGGGVEANVARWIGQFRTADGEAVEPQVEELEVSDMKVNFVTLSGVYLERRGPFAPATAMEDYRMLGAIVDLPGGADLFIKLTAPAKTADAAAKGFESLVKSLKPAK